MPRWVFRYVGNKAYDFSSKKKDFLPKNDQIWPKIGIFGQFGPGHAGFFGALLVGRLVVVARGLYLARHLFTLYILKKNPLFALKSKLWPAKFLEHRRRWFCFSRNKGQLRAAVTRPCRLPTPLCHTYSEPSGHELSPGGTQNIPYLFKNLSKSRLSDPFFGLFLVISEVGSQIYIANLAIECFQQLFGMKSHCMP